VWLSPSSSYYPHTVEVIPIAECSLVPSAAMPSRSRRDQSPDPIGKPLEPTTTDQEETYVSSSLARFYLTHLTATLIHYQGFTSCQAEVIAELERKVEEREYRGLLRDAYIVISLNLTLCRYQISQTYSERHVNLQSTAAGEIRSPETSSRHLKSCAANPSRNLTRTKQMARIAT
jgi:hypothetical protein